MSTITFDTLKFVKTLEAAGVSAPQAEAISVAVRDSQESIDVATKRDLKELEVSLRHEISDLRKDMDSKLEKMELRMTVKLGSIVVLAIGSVAAIVRFM